MLSAAAITHIYYWKTYTHGFRIPEWNSNHSTGVGICGKKLRCIPAQHTKMRTVAAYSCILAVLDARESLLGFASSAVGQRNNAHVLRDLSPLYLGVSDCIWLQQIRNLG